MRNKFSLFHSFHCTRQPKQKYLYPKSISNDEISDFSLLLKHTLISVAEENENRDVILINKILESRRGKIRKIQAVFKGCLLRMRIYQYILMKKLLDKREELAEKIQRKYKAYKTRRHFKELLSNDAVFLYNPPMNFIIDNRITSEKTKDNKLVLYLPKLQFQKEFKYSSYLESFYLPFKQVKILKKSFMVNFIVNGNKVIDSRYEVTSDNTSNYYNIIYSTMLFRKIKYTSPRVVARHGKKATKYWEQLFTEKFELSKAQQQPQQQPHNTETSIKPILKSKTSFSKKCIKRVCFKEIVDFSY